MIAQEVSDAKKETPYPPAFRTESVQLIRSGRIPLSEIAKEPGCLTRRCATGCARSRSTRAAWRG
jgi:hypothetical protein